MRGVIKGHRVTQGVLFMLLSVFLHSTTDCMMKWLGGNFDVSQIVFCRAIFSFIPLAYCLFKSRNFHEIKPDNTPVMFLRALTYAVMAICFTYAFMTLPLADAYAVTYIGPLFIGILSTCILGEKASAYAWQTILIGFGAILYMMQPGSAVFSWGGVAALIAAFTYALSMVLSRYLSRTESSFSISIWANTVILLGAGVMVPFAWVTPSLLEWGVFIALGLAGGIAQLALTEGYGRAPAYIVGPLDYLLLVCGIFWGYVFWAEVPTLTTIIGSSVLIACGLFIGYKSARGKKDTPVELSPQGA